jgi:hypothetical protein
MRDRSGYALPGRLPELTDACADGISESGIGGPDPHTPRPRLLGRRGLARGELWLVQRSSGRCGLKAHSV